MLGAAILVACSSEPSTTYTITGYFIKMDSDSMQMSESEVLKLDETISTAIANSLDLSTATVSISQTVTNEAGESRTVELDSGSFIDGTVEFQGEIDELAEVVLTVETNTENPLKATALIGPGVTVSFALIDVLDSEPDRLILYGTSKRVKDPAKKFSISGDLEGLVKEEQLAIVELTSESWDVNGERLMENYGSVLLRDGRFQIEADIEDPKVVDIFVEVTGDPYAHITGVAVVQPNTSIEVTARETSMDLMTTSDAHLHSLLVESWQKNETYQVKMDRAQQLRQKFLAEWQAQQAEPTDDGKDVIAGEATEDAQIENTESSESENSSSSNVEIGSPPAEGCEHLVMTDVKPTVEQTFETPDFRIVEDEAWQLRVDTLENIALNTDDPWIRLLAIELGAFNFFFGDLDRAVNVHDELLLELDENVATKRLTPRRDILVRYIQIYEMDKSLVPGQKAPLFTLPNLQGEPIELLAVLQKKDLVYVDFWASWCGPCIATFPALKDLYASFYDYGFEIVVVSIDDTFEEWKEASLEHDLPWLNLADIGGIDQETPLAYGVNAIPKAYLIDTKGCIVQKDVSTDMLEEFLSSRYADALDVEEAGSNNSIE